MTPFEKMYMIKPETTVEDCMVLITAKRIRHLPVFDGGKFVGLISIGDVIKSMLLERDSMIEHLSDYISGKYVYMKRVKGQGSGSIMTGCYHALRHLLIECPGPFPIDLS
ncbi:MAG: CBS domain-containing protein [Desulfobacterales bacterium]|nr:CBS domain-containing protein [Desulfobacterales bacterium]